MRIHSHVAPRALLLACCLIGGAGAADYEQSAAELEEVRSRIQALNERLADTRDERDALRDALENAERAASEATAALADTRRQLDALHNREQQAEARVRAADAALQRHRDALADQLRAAWRLGRQPELKLLLEQDDPSRLGLMRAWFARIGAASGEALARARAAQAEHEEALAALAETRRALKARRDEQESLLARVEQRRAQRDRTMAALQKRMAADASALETARRDARELEALLEELRATLADIPADAGSDEPLGERRGALPWPLRGPVLAAFGQERASGLPWKGIWIAAESGTPARAVANGRVAWAGWMHRYGLVVILEHAGGYYSLYGHAERSLRRVGEWVEAGATVVTAGDSGGQPRSGVYLELRSGADALDPIAWLQPRD